jgi:ribulose-phosphate 3-epimerase
MINIIPAILEKSLKEFEEKLSMVWGNVSRVQVDVIDGKFAKNKTIAPEDLAQVDTVVAFDAHLMVEKPEEWIKRCVAGGIDRVFGQVEMMKDKVAFIGDVQAEGMMVGLGYDIDTPLDGLEEYINDLDAVLLMSVKAGEQGRKFDERVLEKIKQVRKLSKRIHIVVDGGEDEENIKKCIAAEWAEEMEEDELNRSVALLEFVVGSHLFKAENVKEELFRLQKLEKHS